MEMIEADRLLVSDEMYQVPFVSKGFSQLCRQHPAATIGGITNYADAHELNPARSSVLPAVGKDRQNSSEVLRQRGDFVDLSSDLALYRPLIILMKQFVILVILIVLAVLGVFSYFHYFFAYQEGDRAGVLIKFVKSGYMFKTYEGEMIQLGLKSSPSSIIATKDFLFSVSDNSVADSLMNCNGKEVVLHYKSYNGTLPWRGSELNVVDGIRFVNDTTP